LIQLTVSIAVSESMFQKRFQKLVSRDVSETVSDSRFNELASSPDFRTDFNRVILKACFDWASRVGQEYPLPIVSLHAK